MHTFWTNTIWYILLVITTMTELLYVLIRSKERKVMFALFLSFAGLAYFIEIQILLVFKGYTYYPKIFDGISQMDDGLIGNTFSQFSIAATALMISFLNLKKYWYILFALIYGGIEELFLYLGIYKHNWYATWMTVVGFSILLWLMNKIYQKTFKKPGSVFQYVIMFPAAYVPYWMILTWPFRLSGYPPFSERIFPDAETSIVFCNVLLFLILLNTVWFATRKRLKWPYHVLIILGLYLVYYLAYRIDFIIYNDIWMLLLFATAAITGMYLCILAVRKLYGFPKGENQPPKAADPKPMY